MKDRSALIVDDSEFTRLYLRSVLEQKGCRIAGEAGDARSAIRLYQSERPDFVTMDMNMPNESGLESIRAISKLDPNARFVVVSAVEKKLFWDLCGTLAICEYVPKPIEWPKLESAIKQVLEAPPRASESEKRKI